VARLDCLDGCAVVYLCAAASPDETCIPDLAGILTSSRPPPSARSWREMHTDELHHQIWSWFPSDLRAVKGTKVARDGRATTEQATGRRRRSLESLASRHVRRKVVWGAINVEPASDAKTSDEGLEHTPMPLFPTT